MSDELKLPGVEVFEGALYKTRGKKGEQMAEQLMPVEQFEQAHQETGSLIARVGKIWEGVAERQQAIIDGKGYSHRGYSTWAEYWATEWFEASGWTSGTVTQWINARNVKHETSPFYADVKWDNLKPEHWKNLGNIEDPEDRVTFLDQYETEIKPRLREEGVSSQIFREGVKDFTGKRDVPRETKNPRREMVYKLSTFDATICDLDPEEVAEHAYNLRDAAQLQRDAEKAQSVSQWFADYAKAIENRSRSGIRAVN